ncbi:MAG: hypothetical protein ACD_2C00016G0002 [uncultured bacterium (gcode 4)]|uniref:Uncharacterized protein n=1 Tax=uncultured bacterium (gcode 4) TaxID=1234023 RepID=K2FGI2_9BACT|nr:MAG: hypothetical protein ACD_2C00016G0002 [uncultured bacterium (gcode 4)]
MVEGVKLCNHCVRNINSPFVDSENWKCSFCIDFENHKERLFSRLKAVEGKFLDNIKRSPWKGIYDCIVLVSWWKDSIMTLYKIKKDTDLRILAYTFDNWFESEEALENIRKAVEKLEIDWMLDKPWYILKVLKVILMEKIPSSICRFCAPIMINRAIKKAKSDKIPYIVTWWNKWQSDREPSRFPLWNIPKVKIRELLQKYPFLKNIWIEEQENEKLLKKYGIQTVSPWIHELRDTKAYTEIITRDLWWVMPKVSYPKESTNCVLNFLQVVLSRKYFGYTHYDCEESMLINFKENSRENAQKILDADIDKEIIENILNKLSLKLEDIGLNEQQLAIYSKFQ